MTSPNRWQIGLSGDDQDRIRELIETAGAHDGVAPVGDQVLRQLNRDTTGHLLARDGDELVGYLNLVPADDADSAMAEMVVRPDARRRGVGTALLREGLAKGGPAARVWAHGNLESARALTASLGLVAVRELLQMSRPLSGLPAGNTRIDGVTVRGYGGPADDEELLRVNNSAFSWHPEQGGWTEQDIAERRTESWFDADGLFLAFDDDSGRLLGFHWTKVHGQTGPGEVYVVGVDPAAQGRGLGSVLTLIGLRYLAGRLSQATAPEVILYVEADNTAAVNTYRKLGFAVATADVAYARAV